MTDTFSLDVPDGVYSDVPGWSGMIRHPDIVALTAGAYPVAPPSTWFDNPGLTSLTPLTIDDNGRVYGHIAAWHTSHIGMAGGVKPPRSKSNYAYYRTGVVKCDDGKMVDVGQITLTGGHAPLNAGVSRAVAHYDDTASAIMDVAAGEDKHGIWVAGALRPDVTDAQLRAIRASSVSGDWRPINGKLELVAVCAVNAPGFPIPRARVASGAPIALVAAGIEPLVEIAMQDRIKNDVEEGIQAGLELFRERILRLENVVLADGSPDVADKPEVDVQQLRKRVRGGSALAASLRERVRGQSHPAEIVSDVEALAASLRERVKGSDVDPKGSAPKALTAARKPWNPLLHPRGADGRFIEVGSWVRWLRQGFGSTRRGKVVAIVPDKKGRSRDGIITKVVAQVEFPDRDGKTLVHEVPFDELERVAAPKGSVSGDETSLNAPDKDDSRGSSLAKKIAAKAVGHLIHDDEHGDDDGRPHTPGTEDGNDTMERVNLSDDEEDAVEEAVEDAVAEVVAEIPDTPAERANPTEDQLEAEQLAEIDPETIDAADADEAIEQGLIETPYVPPSDEWQKTSEWFVELQQEGTDLSRAFVSELHPNAYSSTSEWADALRLARSRFESWRTSRLAQNPEADVSLAAYLEWLEERGLKASGEPSALVARATDYWTEEKRKEAADKGWALPDGSYPIEDVEDLKKAIQSYGRAKNERATKRHIMKRAHALGKTSLLPKGWAGSAFDPAKHLRGPDGRFLPKGKPSKGKSAKTASAADSVESKAKELRGRVHRDG